MMDTFDDRLDDAARELGEQLPRLGDSLDDAVMAAIRRRAAPASGKQRGWRWLLEPRTVRIRPIWAGAGLAAAAVLLLWLVATRRTVWVETAQIVAPAAADTVFVHFAISAPQAHEVALVGSFNGWDTGQLRLRQVAGGTWEATIPLPVGEHRYLFVVDGQRWIPDPAAQSQVEDGFGGTNSVIVVGPKGVVRS